MTTLRRILEGLIVKKRLPTYATTFLLICMLVPIPCKAESAKQIDRNSPAGDPSADRGQRPPVIITLPEDALATLEYTSGYRVRRRVPHVMDRTGGQVEIDIVSWTLSGTERKVDRTFDKLNAKLGFRTSTAAVDHQLLEPFRYAPRIDERLPKTKSACSEQKQPTSTQRATAADIIERQPVNRLLHQLRRRHRVRVRRLVILRLALQLQFC